ncbi:MAG: ImmA/IrrE family metallo-endopeptidase [Planctomyces sp.]
MKPKLIKTEREYRASLNRLEEIFDAEPGTPDGDEAELLTALIQMYEKEKYPIDLPDPIAAIKFRMEQQGLKAKDLIPLIGSKSKVSEVLSGQRELSKTMIRNLSTGLGIPADVLLQDSGATLPSDTSLKVARHFPIAEMVKRSWFAGFEGTATEAKSQLEDLISGFLGSLDGQALLPALNRQHIRDGSTQNPHALNAWRIRVANLALNESLPVYKSGSVNEKVLREIAKLSYLDSGPQLAKEFLNKCGIHMIVERHLPKTHLDGAALRLPDGSPVVALTLRYDRLDHFWFTLFHELAHVALHLDKTDIEVFFDDLTDGSKSKYEREADALASDALIADATWRSAKLSIASSPKEIVAFASKLRISPAIPAGRLRFESKDYTTFSSLVGNGKVRAMFET